MIGSLAMAMRYTFDRVDLADRIEGAIAAVLEKGLRTADIKGAASSHLSTREMGDGIVAALRGVAIGGCRRVSSANASCVTASNKSFAIAGSKITFQLWRDTTLGISRKAFVRSNASPNRLLACAWNSWAQPVRVRYIGLSNNMHRARVADTGRGQQHARPCRASRTSCGPATSRIAVAGSSDV